MVKVKEDLTGKIFGRLKVLRQVDDYVSPQGWRQARWECECLCDKHKKIIVTGRHLKSKHTQSCGCLMIEVNTEKGYKSKKYNTYDLSGEYGIGWTYNTNKEFYFDLDDYEKIKNWCWSEHRTKKYSALEAHLSDDSIVRMHWLIVGKDYDHVDRNPLNNRKSNLRKATDSENNCNHSLRSNNTSGISGVSWDKRNNMWLARISINQKYSFLGYFQNKEDAIKARLIAELKYYGEFAPQRHLYEEYGIEFNTIQNDYKENLNEQESSI